MQNSSQIVYYIVTKTHLVTSVVTFLMYLSMLFLKKGTPRHKLVGKYFIYIFAVCLISSAVSTNLKFWGWIEFDNTFTSPSYNTLKFCGLMANNLTAYFLVTNLNYSKHQRMAWFDWFLIATVTFCTLVAFSNSSSNTIIFPFFYASWITFMVIYKLNPAALFINDVHRHACLSFGIGLFFIFGLFSGAERRDLPEPIRSYSYTLEFIYILNFFNHASVLAAYFYTKRILKKYSTKSYSLE